MGPLRLLVFNGFAALFKFIDHVNLAVATCKHIKPNKSVQNKAYADYKKNGSMK
jgi:hypothetical protein